MNSPRLWIVLLVLESALAGLAGGVLLARSMRGPEAPSGPFADYETLLVEELDLGPERARLLHQLLLHYHQEIEDVKQTHQAAYVSAMEPDLVLLGRRYHGLVRDHVVPPDRRAVFDRRCAGVTLDPERP